MVKKLKRTDVTMHTITKRNGEEVIFFTDFDYAEESVVDNILNQAKSGDCGDFLQGSAKWAMDMWTKGNPTGYMWALKVASDIRAHLKARITLRATYALFLEGEEIFATEVAVKDTLVLRLSWDKDRQWVWVKRMFPIRHADRTYDTVTFGAIWPDGIYRQLSRNEMSEVEIAALKAFNRNPVQQWVDKRNWIRYDELFDKEDDSQMTFPSEEEAERWERARRVREYMANEAVNDREDHLPAKREE